MTIEFLGISPTTDGCTSAFESGNVTVSSHRENIDTSTTASNEFQKGPRPNPLYFQQPTSIQEIDETMTRMDKLFQMSFSSWIKDHRNIAYFCRYKASMFEDYFKANNTQALMALAWMTSDWDTVQIAEIFMKLFYKHGIASHTFVTSLFFIVTN
jgi:hypothetical protein